MPTVRLGVAALLLLTCGSAAAQSGTPLEGRDAEAELLARTDLYWAAFGYGLGSTGLFVEDLDADGRLEVAFHTYRDSADLWFAVGFHDGEYVTERASVPLAEHVAAMDVAQCDPDPALEIVAAFWGSGEVAFFDGRGADLEATISTDVTQIRDLVVGDVDADGAVEAVLCDAESLYVFDLSSGDLEAVRYGFGGRQLSLGEVDGDAPLEIAIANEDLTGYVLDGLSLMVQWGDHAGFGYWGTLADLDGDTHDEVVMTEPLRVYDLDTQEYLFALAVDSGPVAAGDVDHDGQVEVVYKDTISSEIHVIDGRTGVEEWSVTPTYGAGPFAIGNTDEDGAEELVWTEWYAGANFLVVFDADERVEEWRSLDLDGPFYSFDSGDVDADGMPELVSSCLESDGGHGASRYLVFDAITWRLEHASDPPTGPDFQGLWRVRLAPLDEDPALEVCVTSSVGYTGELMCFDGSSHELQWSAAALQPEPFRALEVADVDADGELEVAAATPESITVYHADGQVEWQSAPFPVTGIPYLGVADVDGDLLPEVVVLLVRSSDAWLMVLEGDSGSPQLILGDYDATTLETPDRDGDGVAEVVIGTRQGRIQTIDPATGYVVADSDFGAGSIDALRIVEVAGYGGLVYLVVADNRLRAYDGTTLQPILATDELAPHGVGENDSMHVADVDWDGWTEVAVNLGVGYLVIELRSAALFDDGFETGDTAAWSAWFPWRPDNSKRDP